MHHANFTKGFAMCEDGGLECADIHTKPLKFKSNTFSIFFCYYYSYFFNNAAVGFLSYIFS